MRRTTRSLARTLAESPAVIARALARVLAGVSRPAIRAVLPGLVSCAMAFGCAHRPSGSVPIENRPTPAQPGPTLTEPARPAAPAAPRLTARERAVADTLAARRSLRRCAGRKLLVEQESTFESTSRLLVQARAALAAGDVQRAGVLAREARSLAASLGCP